MSVCESVYMSVCVFILAHNLRRNTVHDSEEVMAAGMCSTGHIVQSKSREWRGGWARLTNLKPHS